MGITCPSGYSGGLGALGSETHEWKGCGHSSFSQGGVGNSCFPLNCASAKEKRILAPHLHWGGRAPFHLSCILFTRGPSGPKLPGPISLSPQIRELWQSLIFQVRATRKHHPNPQHPPASQHKWSYLPHNPSQPSHCSKGHSSTAAHHHQANIDCVLIQHKEWPTGSQTSHSESNLASQPMWRAHLPFS